jgi:hypothetical protein
MKRPFMRHLRPLRVSLSPSLPPCPTLNRCTTSSTNSQTLIFALSRFAMSAGLRPSVRGLASEDACSGDMLLLIRWQGRTMAVPLSQLTAIYPDESTREAIKDWHYWVAQGYCF